MKYGRGENVLVSMRRSPCGERGLKLLVIIRVGTWSMSLPVRGAWVEIDAPELCLW